MLSLNLSQLVPGKAVNARHNSKIEIDSLAASIERVGLIQSLLVRPVGAKFEVIGGNRRLNAIKQLAKAGRWDTDHKIPCIEVTSDDTTALELSLAENLDRVPLHPVDQFRVFAAQETAGRSIPEIAARYAIDEKQVRQRLALGKLAPKVLDAWRAEKISAEIAQCFTLSEDHDLQERVLAEALKEKHGMNSWRVRRAMTQEHDNSSARELAFVGADAYRAAGGRITEDLFSDDVFVADPDILDRLATEKRAAICAEYKAAGWSDAFFRDDREDAHYYDQIDLAATDEERALLDDYLAKRAGNKWQLYNDKYRALKNEIFERTLTPEVMARTSVILAISYEGKVTAEGGMLPPPAEEEQDAEQPTATPEPKEDSQGISAALSQKLSESRTDALAKAVAADHDAALSVMLAAMTQAYNPSPCRVRATGIGRDWKTIWPALADAEFPAALDLIRAMTADERSRLMAQMVADSIDDTDAGRRNGVRAENTKALVQHLDDMTPLLRDAFDAEGYFAAAPKPIALAVLAELGKETPPASAKKAAVAALAAQAAREEGWLPKQMSF